MIGGWEKYGYFVDPTQRDHLVIRDMSGNSEEECLYFNHTFSENDLDFPEEDDINLRVFSSDNQIFYFVQVKTNIWTFIKQQNKNNLLNLHSRARPYCVNLKRKRWKLKSL